MRKTISRLHVLDKVLMADNKNALELVSTNTKGGGNWKNKGCLLEYEKSGIVQASRGTATKNRELPGTEAVPSPSLSGLMVSASFCASDVSLSSPPHSSFMFFYSLSLSPPLHSLSTQSVPALALYYFLQGPS